MKRKIKSYKLQILQACNFLNLTNYKFYKLVIKKNLTYYKNYMEFKYLYFFLQVLRFITNLTSLTIITKLTSFTKITCKFSQIFKFQEQNMLCKILIYKLQIVCWASISVSKVFVYRGVRVTRTMRNRKKKLKTGFCDFSTFSRIFTTLSKLNSVKVDYSDTVSDDTPSS